MRKRIGQYLPHLSKSPFVELVSTCDIVYERQRKGELNIKYPIIIHILIKCLPAHRLT